MKNLNKITLNFDETLKYVIDDLDKTNTLSDELVKFTNFKNGDFFTLLPEDANLNAMHDFKTGWILPTNPIEAYVVSEQIVRYSIKNSIRVELEPLIINELSSHPYCSCIIDKVTGSADDVYYSTYADCNPVFYETEVYFLLNKNNISRKTISKCLTASTSFWHSLCLITGAKLANVTKKLDLEKIKEICTHAELIMVGAYDGEGYVFWENNPGHMRKGFFE